jgi:hypothetical protein
MSVHRAVGSTHERASEPHTRGPRLFSRFVMSLSAIGVILAALGGVLAVPSSSQAATAIGLGTADSFAVLAGQGVTNTGPSVVNGDLGTYPNPAVTGFGGSGNGTVNGTIHQADTLAGTAMNDLTTAYNNAAGQGPPIAHATELGGSTLTPGVYDASLGTFGITAGAGALTLNAQGDPNAVFIFKAATTLITGSASQVLLVNGAQSCNVFWQVGSSATLGTSSTFVGNILAQTSVQVLNGVNVDGRVMAQDASVTLDNDVITRAQCATPSSGGSGGGGGGTGGGGGSGGGGGTGGGNGNGNGNGNGGKPGVQITNVAGGPGNRPGEVCTGRGFRAKVSVHDAAPRMKSVQVFVDGKLIKQTTSKQFSVWVSVAGLRNGRNTIRVVAVDRDGNRRVVSRTFSRCAPAIPSPSFTG